MRRYVSRGNGGKALHIVDVREQAVSIASPIAHAYIDFSKTTCPIVAVIADHGSRWPAGDRPHHARRDAYGGALCAVDGRGADRPLHTQMPEPHQFHRRRLRDDRRCALCGEPKGHAMPIPAIQAETAE